MAVPERMDGGMSAEIRAALDRMFNSNEWLYVDELRNGTGYDSHANGYMDGFAINCYPSKRFERIAFEIKISRADFTRELRQPLKRKVALLYSNRYYFVTPAGLLRPVDLPPEAGLMELHPAKADLWNPHPHPWLKRVVEAPWRDTPPPSWSLFCSMARSLRAKGLRA